LPRRKRSRKPTRFLQGRPSLGVWLDLALLAASRDPPHPGDSDYEISRRHLFYSTSKNSLNFGLLHAGRTCRKRSPQHSVSPEVLADAHLCAGNCSLDVGLINYERAGKDWLGRKFNSVRDVLEHR